MKHWPLGHALREELRQLDRERRNSAGVEAAYLTAARRRLEELVAGRAEPAGQPRIECPNPACPVSVWPGATHCGVCHTELVPLRLPPRPGAP